LTLTLLFLLTHQHRYRFLINPQVATSTWPGRTTVVVITRMQAVFLATPKGPFSLITPGAGPGPFAFSSVADDQYRTNNQQDQNDYKYR
jgi:hypothetical protein